MSLNFLESLIISVILTSTHQEPLQEQVKNARRRL